MVTKVQNLLLLERSRSGKLTGQGQEEILRKFNKISNTYFD